MEAAELPPVVNDLADADVLKMVALTGEV